MKRFKPKLKNSRKSKLLCALAAAWTLCAVAADGGADPLREAAQSGDAASQLKLGYAFFFGQDRNVNPKLAVYWFRQAAEQNHPEAIYNLGMCYLNGWGVDASRRMAYFWLERASDRIPDARAQLAALIYTGVPAEENEAGRFAALPAEPEKALTILDSLAQKDVTTAQTILATIYYRDPKLREENGQKIRHYLEKAVQSGHCPLDSYLLYVTVLQDGIGGLPEMQQAARILEKLAATGDPEAMIRFSIALDEGFGCARDPERSLSLLEQAVAKNSPRAMVRMGKVLLLGEALPHDPAAALRYFERAAEMQYPPAWRELGICYSAGIGVEKDLNEAFDLFERSARAGDPEGAYLLGVAFRDGQGIAADPEGAFYWFRTAAFAGHPGGMRETGVALFLGRGTKVNREIGVKWLRRAARAGDAAAEKWFRENQEFKK